MKLPRLVLRLNAETRTFHMRAAERWLELVRPTVTRADYIRQLERTYGFEAPLEAALAYAPGVRRLAIPQMRSGLIAQDLLSLGIKPSALSNLRQCNDIGVFGSAIEALGWIYVTARATWYYDLVRRNVRTCIPEASGACAYLSASEGVSGTRWLELGRTLDRTTSTEAEFEELIAGACAAFRSLIAWNDDQSVPIAVSA